MFKAIVGLSFLVAVFFAPALAEDSKLTRTIQVNGHGEVRVVPDMAVVTMGVVTSAPDSKSALAANTKAMSNLMAQLKAANVADKDIQTSNFAVQPQMDYSQKDGKAPKVLGYEVSNTVTVSLRKVESIGDVLDKVVAAGSNQINGISFTVVDPQAATDEARKAAMADAQRKATLLSTAGGVKLGPITSITEGGAIQPQPVIMMRSRAMAADAASPVPVAQGEQVISADVNVVWALE